jgi:DNA-binding CsgD family transcriptional regulator
VAGAGLGSKGVTRREAQVLEAHGERLTNAEIAERLYLSERTVESHVSSLLRKLSAANRLELAALAKEALAPGPAPAPLPAPLELLADAATYIGRTAERDRLLDLWAQAGRGHVLVGVVAGEAGIGKSRLVAEVAARVHAGGGRVLLGACFEDLGLPYEPFAQAVAEDAATLDDRELRRRAGAMAGALLRIVPELAPRLAVAAPGEALDPVSAQAEVFAALHGYVGRAAEAQPVLLVVEDVHWATPSTRAALRHLARTSGHAPVLVLATTRDAAPDLDDELTVFLAELERLPSVTWLGLDGLQETEVAALLADLGGGGDAASVRAETGGNPLFVQAAADDAGRASRSVSGLLASREAALPPGAAELLDVASAIGTEFDADLLAAAAGRPMADVLRTLEAAGHAGLLAHAAGRPGRFSFHHALYRTARYDGLPAPRRMELHQAVARALEEAPDTDRVLPELARHACAAAPLGGARQALDHAVRAAELAHRSLALGESADQYRRALEVADLLDPPDVRLRLSLTIRLGEVLQGARTPGWRSILLDAAATARSIGDAAALGEVGWAMVRYGGPSNPSATDHEFAAILQEALVALGPEPTAARARTLAVVSEDLAFTEPERAEALVEEARAIARALDDPVTLGHVLLSYRISARTPDNGEARQQTADELIALGYRTGQPTFTIVGLSHRAWCYRESGALSEGMHAMHAALELQGERALPPTYAVSVLLFRAADLAVRGSLVEAEALTEEVWSLTGEGFDAANWYAPALLLIRHAQGRIAELVPMIELAGDQPGIGPAYRCALAVACAQVGRLDEARAIVEEFAADGFASLPRNFTWLAALAALAEAAEWVADPVTATALEALLEPYSGRIADLPQAMVGPLDLALAQVALAADDPAMAAQCAARAVADARRHGAAIHLARSLVRQAEAHRRLLQRGAVDLGATPEELVGEALRVADRTGAQLVRHEAGRYGLVP